MPSWTPLGQRSSVVGRRRERAHDPLLDRDVVLGDVELRDVRRPLGRRERSPGPGSRRAPRARRPRSVLPRMGARPEFYWLRHQTNSSMTRATSAPGTGPTRTSHAPSTACVSRPRMPELSRRRANDRRAAVAGRAAPADVDAELVALDGPDRQAVGACRSELGSHASVIGVACHLPRSGGGLAAASSRSSAVGRARGSQLVPASSARRGARPGRDQGVRRVSIRASRRACRSATSSRGTAQASVAFQRSPSAGRCIRRCGARCRARARTGARRTGRACTPSGRRARQARHRERRSSARPPRAGRRPGRRAAGPARMSYARTA